MALAQNALTTLGPLLADLNLTLPAGSPIATWAPTTAVGSNQLIVPRRGNGAYYQANSGGGTTGATPPNWPLVAAGTVVDGTVTWTYQGVSVQSRLEGAINAISQAIEQYCDRQFIYGQWTENIGATGRTFVKVKHLPLRSISLVSFMGGALQSTGDYEIYQQQVDGNGNNVPSETGLIYRQVGWVNTAPFMLAAAPFQTPGQEYDIYQVVYLGGYQTPQFDGLAGVGGSSVAPAIPADLPFELEKACIDGVVSYWRRMGWDRNVLTESFADARVTYRDNAELLPAEILPVLDRYRLPV